MYRFSRSIYRELAPRVVEDPTDWTGCGSKQRVLDSCEGAIRRLTNDRRYFARPARSLFNEIRIHFAMTDQLLVWRVVERNIEMALAFLDRLPEGSGLEGSRDCNAHTRKGTPCQREPLPGSEYCPSHKHLEEDFDVPEVELGRFARSMDRERSRVAA